MPQSAHLLLLTSPIIITMLGFDFQKIVKNDRFRTDFIDLGVIGSGGFAEVHKARNRHDGKVFAVKIITLKPSNNLEETEENFYRSLSEVKIHAQLNNPYVLKYHGCWMELLPFSQQERDLFQEQQLAPQPEYEMVVQDDSCGSDGFVFGPDSTEKEQNTPVDQPSHPRPSKPLLGDGKSLIDYKQIQLYMLTQPCEMNLQTYIYQRGLEEGREEIDRREGHWERNLELALEMTKGLSYIHSKRIIHRDIKLHNFLLDDRNQCKLIDFGLARKARFWKSSIEEKMRQSEGTQEDEETEDFSKSVGTKLFSSPEQFTSEKYDYRTDIFSLAMVIVLLFCSFTTVHEQRNLLEVIRFRKLDGINMPPRLKSVMHRCLGGEAERASVSQIQNILRQLLREQQNLKSTMPLGARRENRKFGVQRHELIVDDAKGH